MLPELFGMHSRAQGGHTVLEPHIAMHLAA